MPKPDAPMPQGKLPQTERTKLAVAASIDAARELGHNYVGTEHLLLGLLAGEGIAVQVLANVGVDREKVRQGVLELLLPQEQLAEHAKSNRLLAAMSQATPTSDSRHAVAAEHSPEVVAEISRHIDATMDHLKEFDAKYGPFPKKDEAPRPEGESWRDLPPLL